MTALTDTPIIALDFSELGPLYQDYAYGYPHKSAYRTFAPKLRLADLWRDERKDSLFLYLHLPFCEMRCGFCNLFTTANPATDMQSAYLDALERQIAAVRDEVGPFRPAQMALGGGTPTLLTAQMLERVFDLLAREMGGDPASISAGIETSPQTATPDRIALLAERGFERISVGVQSFHEAETRAMGRPQNPTEVIRALETIRAHSFPRLNLDLIYGAANQTATPGGDPCKWHCVGNRRKCSSTPSISAPAPASTGAARWKMSIAVCCIASGAIISSLMAIGKSRCGHFIALLPMDRRPPMNSAVRKMA